MAFYLPADILKGRIFDTDLRATIDQIDEVGVITQKLEFGGIFSAGTFDFTFAAISTDEDIKPFTDEYTLIKLITNSIANGSVTNTNALNFRIQVAGKVGFNGNRLKLDFGIAEDGSRVTGSSAKVTVSQETNSFSLELTAEAVGAAKAITLVAQADRIETVRLSELSLWINSTT